MLNKDLKKFKKTRILAVRNKELSHHIYCVLHFYFFVCTVTHRFVKLEYLHEELHYPAALLDVVKCVFFVCENP